MESWGEPRSKTITWHDPAVGAAAAPSMSGLEFLRAIGDGTLPPPPISQHFDFRPVSVELGDIVFTCMPDESAYNPIGMVHGGLVCTLLDTVTVAFACRAFCMSNAAIGFPTMFPRPRTTTFFP